MPQFQDPEYVHFPNLHCDPAVAVRKAPQGMGPRGLLGRTLLFALQRSDPIAQHLSE